MTSETRARRVADQISEELALMFQRDVADPRLSGITVTGAEVDRELAYATIYVTSPDDRDQVLEGLERAKGFLRSQLAKRIPLRSFPQLRFQWDYSPDRGARVDELLDQLRDDQPEQD